MVVTVNVIAQCAEMAKKKSSKKRKGNEISFRYRIDKVPGGKMSKREVFNALVNTIKNRQPLPRGMSVTWFWRNHPKQDERSGPIYQEVKKSRAGFLRLMLNRIERDFQMKASVRRASRREIEEMEEEEE